MMFLYVVCLGFLVIGPLFLLRGLVDLKRARASLYWPMIEAQVTSSGVEAHSGGHTGRSFEPVVRYQYEHEGIAYEGRHIIFAGVDLTTKSQAEAEQFVATFRPGTRITVRVCPTNPGISVIEPGLDNRVWIALALGGLITTFGIAGLLGKLK